jgi:hypothetical protein
MRKIVVAVALIALVAAALPTYAFREQAGTIFNNPSPGFGKGPAQKDKTLGYQHKHSVPPYGYWGVGPDYGNYRWPNTGPYKDSPRGRPLDALTYAPFPVEADRGTARVIGDEQIEVSWPGGPQGVCYVDFAILDEVGQVMVGQRVTTHPYKIVLPLPEPAQKVRVVVCYDDGISSAVFWVPRGAKTL